MTIHEELPQFDTSVLVAALRDGEQLADPPADFPGDLRHTYGYEVYPIRDCSGEEGNSVFLTMDKEDNGVEPVQLVGPVVLVIQPVMGTGMLIVHTPEEGVSEILLAADGDPDDVKPMVLRPGQSYAYRNIGPGPFIVRDDSVHQNDGHTHFKPEYEVSAKNVELLNALVAQTKNNGLED